MAAYAHSHVPYCDTCRKPILVKCEKKLHNPYRSLVAPSCVLVSLELCEECSNDNATLRKVLEVQSFLECLYHICYSGFTQAIKDRIIRNVFPCEPYYHVPSPPPSPSSTPSVVIPLPQDPVTFQFEDPSQPIRIDGFDMELTAKDLMDHIRDMQGISLDFLANE